MSKPVIYEWVVISSKGEDLYLTENQFARYQQDRDLGPVTFDDFEINPSFVIKSFKRIAQVVTEKYKCKTCMGNGFEGGDVDKECPDCKGRGVTYG